ncbi:hypothetical protein SCORR_v1c02690 [Spiroplasma corruscae]|uniref:Uncharacterized protein n=1 Tax=Spiroplasma corruscae TaxID=216934 RepID=A0A222EP48_9MOLU|nr:hypothetical protein [Spiroplasma corruscae]ASP28043.1 hypothetical protein SCORR_v1c02690 [Spiroplasma corruscae]
MLITIPNIVVGNIYIDKFINKFDEIDNEYYIITQSKINISDINKLFIDNSSFRIEVDMSKVILDNGLIKVEDEEIKSSIKNNDTVYIYLSNKSLLTYLIFD